MNIVKKNKKIILITILILLIGSLSTIEGLFWKCEIFPNVGGPNAPYCKTTLLSLLLLPGFIFVESLMDYIFGSNVNDLFIYSLLLLFNFIFYFLFLLGISKIFLLFKSKKKH